MYCRCADFSLFIIVSTIGLDKPDWQLGAVFFFVSEMIS